MPAQAILVRLYVGIRPEDREHGAAIMSDVADRTSAYFDGATIYDTVGVWQGKAEPSLVIEIATGGNGKTELARMLAEDLRQYFEQESVLMTVQTLDSTELIQ